MSFGRVVGLTIQHIKGDVVGDNNGQVVGLLEGKSANLTNYSVGIFGRVKFLKVLFVHVETNCESTKMFNWWLFRMVWLYWSIFIGDISSSARIKL